MTPKEAKFLWFLLDSGINSDETTQIIAPALNASKKGKIACIEMAAKHPSTPLIGSTTPLS